MSVSEKLLHLAEVKASIRAAIIAKGVSVSEADSFASYAVKIAAISSSGGGEDPGGEEPGDYTYQLYTYTGSLVPGATSGSMPARPIYAPYESWRSDFKIEGGKLYVKNEGSSSYTLLDDNTGWTDVTGYIYYSSGRFGSIQGHEGYMNPYGAGILDGKLYKLGRIGESPYVQRVGETTGWTHVTGQGTTGFGIQYEGGTQYYPSLNICGIKDGRVYSYSEMTGVTDPNLPVNHSSDIDARMVHMLSDAPWSEAYVISDGKLFRLYRFSAESPEIYKQQIGTSTQWTRFCADTQKGICGGELRDSTGSQIGTSSGYVDLSPDLYIRGTNLYRWSETLLDDEHEWIAVWGNTALCRIPVT